MVRRFWITAVAVALIAPALANDAAQPKGPQSHFGRARLGEVAGLMNNRTVVSQANGVTTMTVVMR